MKKHSAQEICDFFKVYFRQDRNDKNWYFCDSPDGTIVRSEIKSLLKEIPLSSYNECNPRPEDEDLIFVWNEGSQIAQIRNFKEFNKVNNNIRVYSYADKNSYYTEEYRYWAYFCKEWAGLTGDELWNKTHN